MRAALLVIAAAAAGALVAGCQSSTPGTPTSTSQPTSAPTTTTTTATTTTSATAGPVSPPAAQVLPPDNSGYVFIETKSGQTRCQIDEKSVGCEAQFTNTPVKDGVRTNGVNLSADGSVEWIVGNLGDIPTVPIDYRTYSAVGWTIDAGADGTRFTNQKTKHGMYVSIDRVDTF
jgi:hypothetical protein